MNGSASLIKKLVVKSAGKNLYSIDDAHKAVFVKNLLNFFDDYARSTARSQFWYLNTAETVVLDNNSGIKAREGFTQVPKTVETIIPLNRYSFFDHLQNKILLPMQM